MTQLRRVVAIALKESRQLLRDHLSLAMVILIPLLQLALFGYAINTDLRDLPAAVADESRSDLSRHLIASLEASQVVRVTHPNTPTQQLEPLLRSGRVSMAIHIPADLERRLQNPQRPLAQLLVDGSDPMLSSAANQLRQLPVELRHPPSPLESREPFALRIYFNPEKRSAVNIVPGIIGVILTMTMVLFTAIAITRERERGNLELLITTPVSRLELMLGKILPYVVIGLMQTTLILLLGHGLFAVPIQGSLLDLYTVCLLFIAASLTLGLLISTVAQTQLQAMQMTFFVFIPSILLSGFMFPFQSMPLPAQHLAELLPMTHFVRLIRGVMLRSAELSEMPFDIAALLLFTAVTLTAAVLRFRKRLD